MVKMDKATTRSFGLPRDSLWVWEWHASLLPARKVCTRIRFTLAALTSLTVAATWFIRRKSFAIGIVASGASIGLSRHVVPILRTLTLTNNSSWSSISNYDQISDHQYGLQQRRPLCRRPCLRHCLAVFHLRTSESRTSSE